MKDSIRADLAKKTEEAYRQIIFSALAGDRFDKLNLAFTSDPGELEEMLWSYDNFVAMLRRAENGIELKDITVARFFDNSYGEMGIYGRCTIEMGLEYDYTIASRDGRTDET